MFVDLLFLKIIVPFIAFVFALLFSIIAYFLRTIHKEFVDKVSMQDNKLDKLDHAVSEIRTDIIYIKTKINI